MLRKYLFVLAGFILSFLGVFYLVPAPNLALPLAVLCTVALTILIPNPKKVK